MTTSTPTDDARARLLTLLAGGRSELTPDVVVLLDLLPEPQRAAFTTAFTLSHAGRHHDADGGLDAFTTWEENQS
jgi:hypothetical protein